MVLWTLLVSLLGHHSYVERHAPTVDVAFWQVGRWVFSWVWVKHVPLPVYAQLKGRVPNQQTTDPFGYQPR